MARNEKSDNSGLEIMISVDHLKAIQAYGDEHDKEWYERIAHIRVRHNIDEGKFPLPWTFLDQESRDWLHEYLKDFPDMRGIRAQMSTLMKAEQEPETATIGNLKMMETAIRGWLKKDLINGYVYVKDDQDRMVPYLVTGVAFVPASGSGDSYVPAFVTMTGYAITMASACSNRELTSRRWSWENGDVIKGKTVFDACAMKEIYHETPELTQA